MIIGKIYITIGVSLTLAGIILCIGLQEVWQSPYVDKNNIAHYKGQKYKIGSPLLLPHKEVESKKYPGLIEIVVKDYRYISWINWVKKIIHYRILPFWQEAKRRWR